MQPIFHNNSLVLFAAQLQDYSHRLARLVSHTPVQFCMSDEHFQRGVPLSSIMTASNLSRPCRLDVSGQQLQACDDGSDEMRFVDGENPSVPMNLPTLHVRRLGFFRIELEPMYLMDRLIDECEQLDLPCRSSASMCASEGEVHRLDVSRNSANGTGGTVSAAVHIMPEDANGRYSITLTRLQGDTFEYHALYRTLRQRLCDLQEGTA